MWVEKTGRSDIAYKNIKGKATIPVEDHTLHRIISQKFKNISESLKTCEQKYKNNRRKEMSACKFLENFR